MNAPGSYGPEHAVNAVSFRRKLDHDHVVTIVCGAGTHVTYRMSNGVEATLPRPTFDQDFEPNVTASYPTEQLNDIRALIQAGLENCEETRAHLGKSEEWATGYRMALTGLAEGLPS